MNKIKFRCSAVTTSVPGGNVAQCDLEFEHDEEKHSVCFGHGAYSFWTDDEVEIPLNFYEVKNKIAVLEKMSSDACNKLYDLEYEMQECQKSYSLQNNLCHTISYYISELNKLIKNEEVKNNKIKYTDDQIENAKLILKEVGVIK